MTSNSNTLSQATQRAYRADWTGFNRWCRFEGHAPLDASEDTICSYLKSNPDASFATQKRRLSGILWNLKQRGITFDPRNDAFSELLSDIKSNTPPKESKVAISEAELAAMLETLAFDLRGLRDRAMLLVGFHGRLRRSEVVALEFAAPMESGAAVSLPPSPSPIVLQQDEGSSLCPVEALRQWAHYSKLSAGPVFRRVSRDGKRVLDAPLSDKHYARLVKKAVQAAGIREDLSEHDRNRLYSSKSLR